MQSLLTYIVTSGRVFKLEIRKQVRNINFYLYSVWLSCNLFIYLFQFVVYSGYFVVLAVLFTVMAIFTITRKIKRGEELNIWKTDSTKKVDVNGESVMQSELRVHHVPADDC